MSHESEEEKLKALRELYPTLSDHELREAEERLDQLATWLWNLYRRLTETPGALEEFKERVAEDERRARGECSSSR